MIHVKKEQLSEVRPTPIFQSDDEEVEIESELASDEEELWPGANLHDDILTQDRTALTRKQKRATRRKFGLV